MEWILLNLTHTNQKNPHTQALCQRLSGNKRINPVGMFLKVNIIYSFLEDILWRWMYKIRGYKMENILFVNYSDYKGKGSKKQKDK